MAKGKLTNEDQKYKTLFTNAPIAYQSLDVNGCIIEVNEAWCRAFGYDKHEVSGLFFGDLLDEESRVRFKIHFEQIKHKGRINNVALKLKNKKGKIHDILAEGITSSKSAGQLRILHFVLKDITTRRQAERALSRSESKYCAVFNGVNEAIFLHDAKTLTIFEANEKASEMYGYTQEEFLNNKYTIFDLTAPDQVITPEFVKENFDKVKNNKLVSIPWKARHKDGRVFWVEVSPKMLSIEGEACILVSVRDITERVEVEHKLRESERKYRLLAENSSDVIAALDQDFKPTYISPSAQLLYGFSRGDFEQMSVFDIIHEDDRDRVRQKVEERLAEQQNKGRITFRIYSKQGEIKWVESSANYFYNEHGQFEGLVINERDVTAQKNLEEQLKESEKEKSLILNATVEMVAYYDTEFKIKWVNQASADILAMEPQDLIGRVCHEVWRNNSTPCEECPLKEVIKTGRYQEGEIHAPDGRFWLLRGYPVFDHKGKVQGVVEFGRDITAEHSLREKSKRHREMLDLIANNTDNIIFLLKVEGENQYRYQYINDRFFQETGFKKDDYLGRLVSDVAQEDELSMDFKKYKEAIAQKKTTLWEEHKPNSNGLKAGLVSLTPIFDRDHNCTYLVGHIADISQRVRAEQALREKEGALETIIENMPFAVFAHDLNGNVVMVNKTAEAYTGYARNELQRMNVTQIDPGIRTRNDIDNIWKKLQYGGVTQLKSTHLKKDGTSYPVELSITAILLKGKPTILGMAKDISERLKAENALKESEKQLRNANATKDKFFSIIAHDLRNPFNSLVGISELLLGNVREKGYEDIDKFASVLYDTAIQGTNLLDNLLTWSRSQSGTIRFQPRKVSIQEILEDSVSLLENMASEKQITLDYTAPSDQIAFGDRDMLRTIIRNLVTNALKFTDRGGKVEIYTEQYKHYYKLTVKDNGVGMEREISEKLFKLGENISTKGTQDEHGTGLGLILCKEFTDRHGGQIGVESEPGVGSTFWFTIPKAPLEHNLDENFV